MKFEYYNPIRFKFGADVYDELSELCKEHKVMIVYGGGTIKENGVYNKITSALKNGDIPYIDYANQTVATYQGILNGIELAKKESVTAIIEIGGTSAMDTGKAIAFGIVHDNLEDYIEGRLQSDNKHLFNIIIPTYPSTGSEANGVCDIMDYKGGGAELFGAWADYCLMDASSTLSLSKTDTAYSALVCFIQTSAWYIGNHQNDIAKGFAETVLKTLLKSLDELLDDPNDMRSRENIMWASCVNTMGIFRSGVDHFYPWTLFSVGYIPRVYHNVSYREALVIAYPVWLQRIAKYHMDDICDLFINVFGISAESDKNAIVEQGCNKIKEIMKKSYIPLSLSSYGNYPSKDYILSALDSEDFGEFTADEMFDMIKDCYS